MEAFWSHRGALLGPSWSLLEPSWCSLGALLGTWGTLGALLEALEPLLGPSWRLPGPSWDSLGPLLGLSGGPLGGLEGPSIKEGEGSLSQYPRRDPKMRLLGPSWAALGALLGALGAVLEASWAPPGALLGNLGATCFGRSKKQGVFFRRSKKQRALLPCGHRRTEKILSRSRQHLLHLGAIFGHF